MTKLEERKKLSNMSSKRKKLHKKMHTHHVNKNSSTNQENDGKYLGGIEIFSNYNSYYFDLPIDNVELAVADAALQAVFDLPIFASFSKVTPLCELAKFTHTNFFELENPRDSFLTSIDKFIMDRYRDAIYLSTVIPGDEMLETLKETFKKSLTTLSKMSDYELSYFRTFLMDGMVLTDAITAATGLAILDQREEVHA
jgi:hypothetical protein